MQNAEEKSAQSAARARLAPGDEVPRTVSRFPFPSGPPTLHDFPLASTSAAGLGTWQGGIGRKRTSGGRPPPSRDWTGLGLEYGPCNSRRQLPLNFHSFHFASPPARLRLAPS